MRAHRRCFIAVAIALLAVHVGGVTLPAARGCASTGTVCMCCRTAAGGHCPMCSRKTPGGECPMCSRARHTSIRCNCSSQGHETPLPSSSDVLAIMPDRAADTVDLTAEAAPSAPVSAAVNFATPPPSPPH
jgi:hypothetical protein